MSNLPQIELYSDPHCPYAYLTAYRLRKLRGEWRGRVAIRHRSLALEYVNSQPTPKPILDSETPILMLEEPEIPYQPWNAPISEWPVTMWPAFEAVKCAERQSLDLADDLDWAIREAFFAQSRCISMRHVLFELAESAGLEMDQFKSDFDGGVTKQQVVDDARRGWEELKVDGSPTFVLPSGAQKSYVGLPKLKLDKNQHYRTVSREAAPCEGDGCLDALREIIDHVAGS